MDGRVSPILEEKSAKGETVKLKRNGDVHKDGMYKIHRIRISRTANCIVSHVTSPSCVWVKLTNHITDQLQITDLDVLTEVEEAREGQYVMAPLRKGLYARARVLQLTALTACTDQAVKRPTYVKVLFIDEGTTAWMSSQCLAKMEEVLSFHPWQAIAVTLFKIKPKKGGVWSDKECEVLRSILGRYSTYQMAVVLSSVYINNYHQLAKVNLVGMENEKDPIGCSIAHMLARECAGVALDHSMFDAYVQKVYLTAGDGDSARIPKLDGMEEWRNRFPDSDTDKTCGADEQCAEWNESGIGPQIKMVDVEWLNAEGYVRGGECIVNAEGRYTISPYELYVRPLLMKKKDDGGSGYSGCTDLNAEQMDAMIAANDELLKLADDLNSFYGHPRNRKPINLNRVQKALEQGRSAYGVAEVDGEVARFMGCWQRVEIIGLKAVERMEEYYCRVRFLDSGGTDIRLLSSVIEIYPIHCERRPLCVQVCMGDIKPAQGDDWSPAARDYLFHELREDVPISLNIIGANRREENSKLSYESTAWRRSNVVFVKNLLVLDGSSDTLESRLVRQGYAVWSQNGAVANPALEHGSCA